MSHIGMLCKYSYFLLMCILGESGLWLIPCCTRKPLFTILYNESKQIIETTMKNLDLLNGVEWYNNKCNMSPREISGVVAALNID